MSDFAAWSDAVLREMAARLGIPASHLVIPEGMTLREFSVEYERRVSIDGEAFWNSAGFIDPGDVSAESGSGNRRGV